MTLLWPHAKATYNEFHCCYTIFAQYNYVLLDNTSFLQKTNLSC